jgi:transcriptional/translational regulatory protein YebC/TACO1
VQVLMGVEDFGTVSSSLQEQGVAINMEGSGLVYIPLVTNEVEDDALFEANEAMLERLLAVDDVDAVYTNCAGLQ